MPKPQSLHAMVLPADEPPRRSSLKRLLLFFDAITLIHPEDRAFLNTGEIVEEFPGSISRIEWAERSVFPRAEGYEETFRELQAETRPLQERGLLKFRPRQDARTIDPLFRLVAYSAAVPNADLVRAALPDVDPHTRPKVPNTMLFGGAVAPRGFRSRFDVAFPEAYSLPEADAWSPLGWLRLGRALKFLEAARSLGSAPVALDLPNQNICLALGSRVIAPGSRPEHLASLSIALDGVDCSTLDAALLDIPWEDVLKIRRETLPRISDLRERLLKGARRCSGGSRFDPTTYRGHIQELQKDLEVSQLEYARKCQELRVAGLLKVAGAAALSTGLEAFVPPSSWVGSVQLLLIGISAAGAAMATELKAVASSYSRVRENPLYFFEKLPSAVQRLK